jgi:tetratricopeptide (TPR) repeat protein
VSKQVLRIDRDTGVRAGVGAALSNIGNVLQELGELQDARKKQEESLQVFTEIGDKRGMGATLGNLGNLLDDLGDLKEALRCYERAYALDEETGYKRGFGFVLSGWGRVLLEEDRLEQARAKLDEGLRIRKEMGSPGNVGDSLLSLALMSLAEDKAGDAERLARDSAAEFAKEGSIDDEATANATLASALLAESRVAEARAASDRATALSRRAPSRQSGFEVGIAVARVQAAEGRPAEACQRLEAVVAEARRLGFTGYELVAREELGLIQTASGLVAGQEDLRSLERDASAKGYRLIARRAAALHGPA